MSQFIVGLTGGIGSGKTTVSDLFQALGIDIIDADICARKVVAKGSHALSKIVEHFGQEIINDQQELDRALLRKKIFADDNEKQWLNNLLHPLIRQQILDSLAQASSSYCLLVAPLLLENGLEKLTNHVLVVDVSKETQITRTIARDNNTQAQVEAIIASQISRDKRIAAANDVINNEQLSFESLEKAVNKLHQKYLNLSQNS